MRAHLKFAGACALSLGLLMTAPLCAKAAVLAGWDVHALPGGSNNFGTSPLAATTTAANLTVGGLTRGSGVGTTGTAASRGWGGTDWVATSATAAATAGNVASFTLVANAGFQLSLGSVSRLDYRRSSAGATSGVLQYQLGSGNFVDIASFSYPSTAASGASVSAIDLSTVAALQNVPAGTVVTLRLVNFGASGTGGTWYLFDTLNTTSADLEVSGTVAASGPPVNGVCGTAQGLTFPQAPVANLCAVGAASVVNGGSAWNWTCAGSNGGQAASCTAPSSADTGCQ
jgi:hypothetical protein